MPSIAGQIDEVEADIKYSRDRLVELNHKLKVEDMTDEKRQELKYEKELLERNITFEEQKLYRLRKENRSSMLVSVMLFFIICVTYYAIWGLPNLDWSQYWSVQKPSTMEARE